MLFTSSFTHRKCTERQNLLSSTEAPFMSFAIFSNLSFICNKRSKNIIEKKKKKNKKTKQNKKKKQNKTKKKEIIYLHSNTTKT